MMNEWGCQYNPFNSLKALAHAEYWKPIVKGSIPPPILFSIDPMPVCNLACSFCNAQKVLNKAAMSPETMKKLATLLKIWKTRAVCIGGGGEPSLNVNLWYLINLLHNKCIKIGMVTNGTVVSSYLESIDKIKWVGVSVDSATPKTYAKIKGKDCFTKVIDNIQLLTNSPAEITYKFLLSPQNYKEIHQACKLAQQLGCQQIHVRPGGDPWFKPGDNSFLFTDDMLKSIRKSIKDAREDFESDKFKVYGITHKFSPTLSKRNNFKKCWASYTSGFVSADGSIGMCCDRRGDAEVALCTIDTARGVWGSADHIKKASAIDLGKCPRCTLTHINEIFENVIVEDKMMYDFF